MKSISITIKNKRERLKLDQNLKFNTNEIVAAASIFLCFEKRKEMFVRLPTSIMSSSLSSSSQQEPNSHLTRKTTRNKFLTAFNQWNCCLIRVESRFSEFSLQTVISIKLTDHYFYSFFFVITSIFYSILTFNVCVCVYVSMLRFLSHSEKNSPRGADTNHSLYY